MVKYKRVEMSYFSENFVGDFVSFCVFPLLRACFFKIIKNLKILWGSCIQQKQKHTNEKAMFSCILIFHPSAIYVSKFFTQTISLIS